MNDMQFKTIRGVLRNQALKVLTTVHARRLKYLSSPRIHFIYFHDIPDAKLSALSELLDMLLLHGAEFVSYGRAVELLHLQKELTKPYICISFDDGLKSCVNASKVLNSYNISAMFFLNGFVLADNSPAAHALFGSNVIRTKNARFMSVEDCNFLLQHDHEIGNHTFFHNNVSEIPFETFVDDFLRNHDYLTARFGQIEHFAWGFGNKKAFTSRALEYVYNSGYKSCASGIRGAHKTNESEKIVIKRDVINFFDSNEITKYFLARSAANVN